MLLQVPKDIMDQSVLYLRICVGGSAGQIVYNGCLVYCNTAYGSGRGGHGHNTITAYSGRSVCRLMSIQSILLSIGEMTVSAVVNGYGADVVAAYATGNRVHQIAALVFLNLSQAFAVYAGQNLGAGKLDRIEEGFKKVALLLLGLSVVAGIFIFCFGEQFVRLFISSSDNHVYNVVKVAGGMLRTISFFYPFQGLIWLYNNTMRGMGEVMIPLISGIIELAVKVGLSVMLAGLFR